MSKLDEIERYFSTSINRAREPELQGEYEDWLIARVRQLETALRATDGELVAIAESDATMGTVDIGHLCQARDYLEDALKELKP